MCFIDERPQGQIITSMIIGTHVFIFPVAETSDKQVWPCGIWGGNSVSALRAPAVHSGHSVSHTCESCAGHNSTVLSVHYLPTA